MSLRMDGAMLTVGQAARHGNASILIELINAGNDVDNPDNRGWRPIHEAAYGNHMECLKILLEKENTDVNWEDYEGHTALYLAAVKGHCDSVSCLLKHGADVNISTNIDSTPLMAAVKAKSLSTVNCLLQKGANTDLQDFAETTALHQAAKIKEAAAIVQSLLEHGAKIDAKEQYNITPVFTAAQQGNLENLSVMIDFLKKHDRLDVLNTAASDGAQPTFLAAQNGHIECLNLLLQSGAECNGLTKDPALLPLHAALHFGHFECARALYPLTHQHLFSMCDSSIFDMVLDGETQEGLKVLIELGMDINYHHPKDVMSYSGSDEFEPRILRFTEHGLTFNSAVSPLTSIALHKQSIKSAELLIKNGAELNCTLPGEVVPLIAALDRRYLELVTLLLSKGANVNYYNKAIQGNLMLFVSMFWYKGLKLLLQHGAEVDSLFSKSVMDSCIESSRFYTVRSRCCDDDDIPTVSMSDMFTGGRILLDQFGVTVFQVLYLLLDYSGSVSLDNELYNFMDTEEHWNILKNITESPRSLSQLCRVVILQAIPPQILHDPDRVRTSIPLPNTVLNYLLRSEETW